MSIRLKSSQIAAVGARCSSQTYLRCPSNSTGRCSHDAHCILQRGSVCFASLCSGGGGRAEAAECQQLQMRVRVIVTDERLLQSDNNVSCSVLNACICVVIILLTALEKWGVRYPPLQKVGYTYPSYPPKMTPMDRPIPFIYQLPPCF